MYPGNLALVLVYKLNIKFCEKASTVVCFLGESTKHMKAVKEHVWLTEIIYINKCIRNKKNATTPRSCHFKQKDHVILNKSKICARVHGFISE